MVSLLKEETLNLFPPQRGNERNCICKQFALDTVFNIFQKLVEYTLGHPQMGISHRKRNCPLGTRYC